MWFGHDRVFFSVIEFGRLWLGVCIMIDLIVAQTVTTYLTITIPCIKIHINKSVIRTRRTLA